MTTTTATASTIPDEVLPTSIELGNKPGTRQGCLRYPFVEQFLLVDARSLNRTSTKGSPSSASRRTIVGCIPSIAGVGRGGWAPTTAGACVSNAARSKFAFGRGSDFIRAERLDGTVTTHAPVPVAGVPWPVAVCVPRFLAVFAFGRSCFPLLAVSSPSSTALRLARLARQKQQGKDV